MVDEDSDESDEEEDDSQQQAAGKQTRQKSSFIMNIIKTISSNLSFKAYRDSN